MNYKKKYLKYKKKFFLLKRSIGKRKMFYQETNFLQSFISLVRECNNIILNIYNTDFDVISKDDSSPLTLADQRSNEHICSFLNNFTNSIIISEENKNDSYRIRKSAEWCWLVDPIDGTKEFVKKNGQFTVNIGLCQFGVPVFGIVSIPVTGEIYYGIKGIGSYKLEGDVTTKLEIGVKDLNSRKLKIVASSSHMNDETKKYIDNFVEPEIVNVGSSIKLLYIAEGKADVYPRIAPTSEWDTCAAHAVVKYAGGKVLQFGSDIEVKYNKENLLNPYFVVY